jgi:hypothetical protein
MDVSEDCTACVFTVRQSKKNHGVLDPYDEGSKFLRNVGRASHHRRPKSESTFLSSAPKFPREQCFLGDSQVQPLCPADSNMLLKMSLQQWWDGTDRGN